MAADSSESGSDAENGTREHPRSYNSYEGYEDAGLLARGMECDVYMGIRLEWSRPRSEGEWMASHCQKPKSFNFAMFSFDRQQDTMRFLHLDAHSPTAQDLLGFGRKGRRTLMLGESRQTIYGL